MPNWAEGYLRLCGTREAICNFISNEMQYVAESAVNGWEVVTSEIKINADTASEEIVIPVNKTIQHPIAYYSASDECFKRFPSIHIKGTRRNFIEHEIDIILERGNQNNVAVFPGFKAAWDVDPSPYVEASRKYGLAIKIDAYERGALFSRHIHIVNGVLKCDRKQEYVNWKWDCACPDYGG